MVLSSISESNSFQAQMIPWEHIRKKDAVYYAVALAAEDIAGTTTPLQ